MNRRPKNEAGVDRRDFMRMLAGSAAAAGVSLPMASCGGGSSTDKKVIVLGLDGLDPKILSALMEMGRLPNFKKLAEMGSLKPLGTTMPALSPVAWSSFITGMTPGGHGIADFIARDPATYTPTFSIYENRDADVTISIGDIHLPVKGGGPLNLRQGKPFWAYLTERDIPAWISKIPTNFPV
ncbi:MAG: alkaline phosphatase family protein [Acidobacteria bacterium]|nr:alkaline phosphatase family protein [Candidatus Sulfomarinibacter sp. MAG AM1]